MPDIIQDATLILSTGTKIYNSDRVQKFINSKVVQYFWGRLRNSNPGRFVIGAYDQLLEGGQDLQDRHNTVRNILHIAILVGVGIASIYFSQTSTEWRAFLLQFAQTFQIVTDDSDLSDSMYAYIAYLFTNNLTDITVRSGFDAAFLTLYGHVEFAPAIQDIQDLANEANVTYEEAEQEFWAMVDQYDRRNFAPEAGADRHNLRQQIKAMQNNPTEARRRCSVATVALNTHISNGAHHLFRRQLFATPRLIALADNREAHNSNNDPNAIPTPPLTTPPTAVVHV